ncbi:MAG: precorrin-6A reductase [Ferroplasma sp.]
MLLLLNGTSDSRDLAAILQKNGYEIIAVASGAHDVSSLNKLGIENISINLNEKSIIDSCRKFKASAIIDASHPYAEYTHSLAMDSAISLGIECLRFERPFSDIKGNNIKFANNYIEAVKYAEKGNNILITTGIKNIENYQKLIHEKNVFVRTLPVADNIELLINMDIKRENIIAMEGIFNEALESAILENYKIDTIVTKDSGFHSLPKINAAIKKGISLIIIKRPPVINANMSYTADGIIKILRKHNIK